MMQQKILRNSSVARWIGWIIPKAERHTLEQRFSSDMRELLALEESDLQAADAVALFCYQAKKWIGSFAAVLDGVDAIVFSGGIGEHCESIRSRICEGLSFLGVSLSQSSNSEHSTLISSSDSQVAVYVIKTDEELLMARSTNTLLATLRPTA